jgi:hypothetical protein
VGEAEPRLRGASPPVGSVNINQATQVSAPGQHHVRFIKLKRKDVDPTNRCWRVFAV